MSQSPNEITEKLIAMAKSAQANAYAPYSGYQVGAAIRTASGQVYAGSNVENVVNRTSACAEQSALCTMVTEQGFQKIEEVVVVSPADPPSPPCGACLQNLLEFSEADLKITLLSLKGSRDTFLLKDILPKMYKNEELKRS